jgi:hypothetical protein
MEGGCCMPRTQHPRQRSLSCINADAPWLIKQSGFVPGQKQPLFYASLFASKNEGTLHFPDAQPSLPCTPFSGLPHHLVHRAQAPGVNFVHHHMPQTLIKYTTNERGAIQWFTRHSEIIHSLPGKKSISMEKIKFSALRYTKNTLWYTKKKSLTHLPWSSQYMSGIQLFSAHAGIPTGV